jgi:cholest-4-en-3-one 26-monooxygenase
MIGAEDPEYQVPGSAPDEALMSVYSYAEELASERRLRPKQDLISVLIDAEVDGEKLNELELDLFFLLLIVAGNETTRNLMSGAMTAFFEHPDQWEILRRDRSLLANSVEEMLRYVTPVMHFRRTATMDTVLNGQEIKEGDKVVFWHTSANRDETAFDDPDAFDVTRSPNNHIAFGGGGPHFCLGANLARMEIRVMFEHLLDRVPDIAQAGDVQRLQSQFINGVKHLPVTFTPAAPVGS